MKNHNKDAYFGAKRCIPVKKLLSVFLRYSMNDKSPVITGLLFIS